MRRSIFFKFCLYRLETSYTASFLFRAQFRRLGYAVSTLEYMETARLLYYYYQACEAGEGIIGHRGIRIFCLSVIKLLPAYGTDHYQNSYLGSLGHCEDQSRFDIDRSPIPHPPTPSKNWPPQNENFYFFDVLTWNFVHSLLTLAAS